MASDLYVLVRCMPLLCTRPTLNTQLFGIGVGLW